MLDYYITEKSLGEHDKSLVYVRHERKSYRYCEYFSLKCKKVNKLK